MEIRKQVNIKHWQHAKKDNQETRKYWNEVRKNGLIIEKCFYKHILCDNILGAFLDAYAWTFKIKFFNMFPYTLIIP